MDHKLSLSLFRQTDLIIKVFKQFIFLILSLTFSVRMFALNIPANIQSSEVDTVIGILGFGTSSKFLSNPYPLGGYTGFEVGMSMEIINIEELSRLGDGTGPQDEFRYNRLTVGKGLYKNVDAFAHFIPFSSSNEVSDFGGLFKWSFYQGKYLPFSSSIFAHLNTMNIQDKFINQNTGLGLMLGVNVNQIALYMGGGYIRARSIFSSSVLDATDPEFASIAGTYKKTSSHGHGFVGFQYERGSYFLIGEIDRYEEPVYSLKLGFRN